ncbi:MAG TPA: TPM domain-containing protein [Candidatus Omnitrophota bacterium]|nr:TPM domain-containing protein [Candidatus Omnitrophota bacterium]
MVNFLDKEDKKKVIEAIRRAENATNGEIRVHLKAKCKDDPMKEARKVFQALAMYHTRERNSVLIFVALKSKRFAIIGDQGIHERVGDSFWNQTRDLMADYFSKGQMRQGIIAGVHSVGEKLGIFFPKTSQDSNELSNRVTEG